MLRRNFVNADGLSFLGGGVSSLACAGSRNGWALGLRVAFAASVSMPVGYRLGVALRGPQGAGGLGVTRDLGNLGQVVAPVVGVGVVAGELPGLAEPFGALLGRPVGYTGASAGVGVAVWTDSVWTGILAGSINIGFIPSPYDIACQMLDSQYVYPGFTVRQALAEITRLAEQVPGEEPVLVIPAPPNETTTVAWVRCWNAHGQPRAGVKISLGLKNLSGRSGEAFSQNVVSALSNAEGIASLIIPRGDDLVFDAWREGGPPVIVTGVDADQLELPALLGKP